MLIYILWSTLVPTVVAQTAMLWGGSQKSVFDSSISTGCDAAMNTSLNCPAAEVQFLSWSMQSVQWNTSQLQTLCTSGCNSSLNTLLTQVKAGCGSENFLLDGKNMTWVQQVDYIQYKFGLVCMEDVSTSEYCIDVEESWNITDMVAAEKATWPQHTSKCYPDVSSGSWSYVVNVNNTCVDPFSESVFDNAIEGWQQSGQMTATDYYLDRGAPIEDDNYGWPEVLEFDEYPLEIQCSDCFLSKFKYGLTQQWGDIWDEITAQIWSNMQANCGLSSQTIVPANNLTGKGLYDDLFAPLYTVNASMCAQVVQATFNTTCYDTALEYQIPSAAILGLNLDVQCGIMANQSICAPPSCPVTMNLESTMSIDPFIAQYSNFTKTQFLSWNPWIDTDIIQGGEVVCVGPPGGIYVPAVVTAAHPSIYTTTATPAYPTPSGSIKNCGYWYEVQPGDYCDLIALNYSLTFNQFVSMNPQLNADCTNLFAGYDYCVAPVNGTTVTQITPTPAAATSTSITSRESSSAVTTSKTSSAASTNTQNSSSKQSTTTGPTTATTTTSKYPTPPASTVSGTTAQCNKWYTVASGDTCSVLEQKFSITMAQIQKWNTEINSACSNLWLGYSYCVSGL